MKISSTWLAGCAALLLGWQCVIFASDSLKLTIAYWYFEDIKTQNLVVDLKLTGQGLLLNASADLVELAHPIGALKKVTLQCNKLVLLPAQTYCSAGKLTFTHQTLGVQKVDFSVKALPGNNHYKLSVENLNLVDGKFSIMVDYEQLNWQASINTLQASQASLAKLVALILPYLDADKKALFTGWQLDSDFMLKANLNGHAQQLEHLKLDLQTSALNMSNKQGKYVAENVVMDLLVDLKVKKQTWLWHTDIKLNSGQAYAEPVFVDFDDSTMSLQAKGKWQTNEHYLVISDALIKHADIVQIKGRYSGSLQLSETLELTIEQTDLAKLYPVWLQPFALGTAAVNLKMAGKAALSFEKKAGDYQLSVSLDNIFIDDQLSRFGLYDLNGKIDWTSEDRARQAQLDWQGGYLYTIPFGQSNLQLETHLSSLQLSQPWTLPILDGALKINEFNLKHSMENKTQWSFDGLLTPISMESLSTALNWPLLHGKLSGIIPKVSYTSQEVKIDGALMVKLFEGTTIIRDLRLTKPLGPLPQLYANIDLRGLDLEILTQTFDFGKISGKLDGSLTDLRLSNWQPVEFDAHFATPEDDNSRRRISQKAIDNLSQIGGGVGGILSRSFLRFFEDFSYQKLGLNCKLHNETCEMSGVAEAKQGYYIVKGGGLPPRINVVGYNRQVDWPDLIERLKAVSQSSGPVIQ
jgi:hypothetical protein